MKIPKAIIPVHTCEPDGHQSISHTSQQNRVPREPVNLLCRWLNGCIYREQVSERHSERRRGTGSWEAREPGAPAGAQEGEIGPHSRLAKGLGGL